MTLSEFDAELDKLGVSADQRWFFKTWLLHVLQATA